MFEADGPQSGLRDVRPDAGSAIRNYFASHDVRYVLCDNNGTEIQSVPKEQVALVAHACTVSGRGYYVKPVATPKRP